MPHGLDPSVAAKLSKVCGMLGSEHDGERAAAAAKASMLLRAHGLSWADVFAPAAPVLMEPEPAPPPHAALARAALERAALLDEWQRNFLGSISRQRRPLSVKQRAALDGILRQLRRHGAGDAA